MAKPAEAFFGARRSLELAVCNTLGSGSMRANACAFGHLDATVFAVAAEIDNRLVLNLTPSLRTYKSTNWPIDHKLCKLCCS